MGVGAALRVRSGQACKLSLWSERLDKMQAPSQAPEKALKLFVSFDFRSGQVCAFAPPGSPLDLHSVIVFPVTVNNAGW